MDRMIREAMEFKVAQETAADAEDGELPSNGHHRQPLDKAALMTPSTDEDATPREAPEADAAAPADTPPARGEADADADGRPAALHHPNVTDRRTTAGGGGDDDDDLDRAWAELRDELEDDLDELEDVVAGPPAQGSPLGGGRGETSSYPVVERAPPERESIEDDLQLDDPGWIQAAGRA